MKKFILIVDDEFGLADILSTMLVEKGYDVAMTINGQLALEQIAVRLPDLVLCDMMMPIMDGPELIAAMKAVPEYANIPVILMTALPEAIPPGVRYDAMLVKPFGYKLLQVELAKLLRG